MSKIKDFISDYGGICAFIGGLLVLGLLAAYVAKHTSSETYITQGTVIYRNYETWNTIEYTYIDNDVRVPKTVHHERFTTQIQCKDDGYIFTDSSEYAYQHTVVNQVVDVEVSKKYYKGEYVSETYQMKRR